MKTNTHELLQGFNPENSCAYPRPSFAHPPQDELLLRNGWPSVPLLPSDPVSRAATGLIRKAWNFKAQLRAFPGAQPVSLTREMFETIKLDQYLTSEKIDGIRYLLVLGRTKSQVTFSVMVDRNLRCFPVSIIALERYYTGSVYDGELVMETKTGCDKTTQAFILFDVIRSCDTNTKPRNYIERMELIHKTFTLDLREMDYPPSVWVMKSKELAHDGKIVCIGNSHNLCFRPKMCHTLEQLDVLCRKRVSLPYMTDGLIFTPVHKPVGTSRQGTLFKWKEVHTLDVLCQLSNIVVENTDYRYDLGMSLMKDDQLVPLSSFALRSPEGESLTVKFVSNLRWQSIMSHLYQKNVAAHKFIGEMVAAVRIENYQAFLDLSMYRLRRDKSSPNDHKTLRKTIVSIYDQISEHELLHELCPVSRMRFDMCNNEPESKTPVIEAHLVSAQQ